MMTREKIEAMRKWYLGSQNDGLFIIDRDRGGATVTDHKWFDPVCHTTGCRSLVLAAALKRLSFAAQTTGGTAGPDAELVAAIEQAEHALLAKDPTP